MKSASRKGRTDSASLVINATAEIIFQAFSNPEAMIAWLPPEGMTGDIDIFEFSEGGTFKYSLIYQGDQALQGKASENKDIIQGEFLELVPNKRMVQSVQFESDDPIFSGKMIQSWLFEPESEGTKVTVICENVPAGIKKEDHDIGLNSTLKNLAAFIE